MSPFSRRGLGEARKDHARYPNMPKKLLRTYPKKSFFNHGKRFGSEVWQRKQQRMGRPLAQMVLFTGAGAQA